MKALSIKQPWAWLIINAGKDIENRSWSTNVRGRVLIHASKSCTKDEYCAAVDFAIDTVSDDYRGKGLVIPGWVKLQRGGIIGSVEIADCVTQSNSPWFIGTYGFVLRDPRPLPLIPYKGQLGFWECDLEVPQ